VSDERLRELERRWQASGAFEDEVAWLWERVRAGELPQEHLEIAAICGHAPAKSVWDALSPALLSSAELVELLSVSALQLAEWHREEIPAREVEGDLAYALPDVLIWLSDQETSSERGPLGWFAHFVEARSYQIALRALGAGIRLIPHNSADLNERFLETLEELNRPPDQRNYDRLAELRDGLAAGDRSPAQQAMADSLRGLIDGLRQGPSELRHYPTLLRGIEASVPGRSKHRLSREIRAELIPWLLGTSA
tara:strand:+ start:435 stop:1190 length:756 start_codon:yes stop_codon:yes gene_type:complete